MGLFLTLFVPASPPPMTMKYCTDQLRPAGSIFYHLNRCLPHPPHPLLPITIESSHFSPSVPDVCVCVLQGGGGVHGAALQAPALWRPEASVRRQEEHLHGVGAPDREREGRCCEATQWRSNAKQSPAPPQSSIGGLVMEDFRALSKQEPHLLRREGSPLKCCFISCRGHKSAPVSFTSADTHCFLAHGLEVFMWLCNVTYYVISSP